MALNSLIDFGPAHAGVVIAALLLTYIETIYANRTKRKTFGVAWWFMGGVAILNLLVVCYVWIDHIGLSRQTSAAELALVEQMHHFIRGESIYTASIYSTTFGPAPTYNPFYYLLATPFTLLFGVNVTTLRLVSVIGVIGAGMVVFRLISERTGTRWWGVVALGLVATAIASMDSYLGAASPEPWLLCCVLLGTYLLSKNRGSMSNTLGLLMLINAFWFRQIGIFFVIGGLGWLTWRYGVRRSIQYYLVAAAFLPFPYFFLAPSLFGENFSLFTGALARQELTLSLIGLFQNGVASYPVLAVTSIAIVAYLLWRERQRVEVWHIQLMAAMLVGLISLRSTGQPDSSLVLTNVWFVIVGLLALHRLSKEIETTQRLQLHVAAIFSSFLAVLRS